MRYDLDFDALIRVSHDAHLLDQFVQSEAVSDERGKIVIVLLLLQNFEHRTPVASAMKDRMNVQILGADMLHDIEIDALSQINPVADFDNGSALAHHLQRLDKDFGFSRRFDDQIRADAFGQFADLRNALLARRARGVDGDIRVKFFGLFQSQIGHIGGDAQTRRRECSP